MSRQQLESLATNILANETPIQRLGRGKTVYLNIAPDYVLGWSPPNGVRELFSNTVDRAHGFAQQMSSIAPFAVELRVRTVQDTAMHLVIEFYICRCRNATTLNAQEQKRDNSNDDVLVVASIVGQQNANGRCVLRLTNYYTRLDHDAVLPMGGTTKASGVSSSAVIGKHGEGFKVGALAILRGDSNTSNGTVAYYTAGNGWQFLVAGGRLMTKVRPLANAPPPRRDAPADPSLHTTVVVRWQSNGDTNMRSLEYMLPRDLYAPLLPAAAADARSAAPMLLFGARRQGDVINSEGFIRFHLDDCGGSLYVSHILIERTNTALPFVHYGDALLKGLLTRERDQVNVDKMGRQFAKRMATMIAQEALDEQSANLLFDILAERLLSSDRKEDAGLTPKLQTVWDYLFSKNVCRVWFAAQFRRRYPQCYPCASDSDESVVRDRLGQTPRRVSRCLYRILTVRPDETRFWPIDRAAEEVLRAAPTTTDAMDLHLFAPVVALVDKSLSLCGSDRRVGRVVVHDTRASALLLDKGQVLHCPQSLFHGAVSGATAPSVPSVTLLARAFGMVVRMAQIAAHKPNSFYEILLPLIASGGINGSVQQRDQEVLDDVVPDDAVSEDAVSLKRACAVDIDREKKRLRIKGDEDSSDLLLGSSGASSVSPVSGSVAAISQSQATSRSLFPDRLDPLPFAPERKHGAGNDDECGAMCRPLTRVSAPSQQPPSRDGAKDIDVEFYVEEGVAASEIDWPKMIWCARVARALLTRVFDEARRKFAVVWAPTARYKALNRGSEHLLIFNAALLLRSPASVCNDSGDAFYRLFVTVCHELTHDDYDAHGPAFVAALQRRIALLLTKHWPEFAREFQFPD